MHDSMNKFDKETWLNEYSDRVYLYIMLRSHYLINQKIAEAVKPSYIQDELFKNIYNIQQLYLDLA